MAAHAQVHPRIAIFQSGYRNRFGHPAPDVVARYRDRGIATLMSPNCGAWRWSAQDDSADGTGACERSARRRYWQYEAGDRSAAE